MGAKQTAHERLPKGSGRFCHSLLKLRTTQTHRAPQFFAFGCVSLRVLLLCSDTHTDMTLSLFCIHKFMMLLPVQLCQMLIVTVLGSQGQVRLLWLGMSQLLPPPACPWALVPYNTSVLARRSVLFLFRCILSHLWPWAYAT